MPANASSSMQGRRSLTTTETAIAVSGFPLLITAGMGAHVALIEGGSDASTMSTAIIVASYGVIALAERFFPWHESWLHSQGDLRTDIGLALTNGVSTSFANGLLTVTLGPALLALAAFLGGAASGAVGSGWWPSEWPWLAQISIALVVAEFGEYSFHRAMHEVPALWRLHATHHSSPRLYWLNAARFHPIDLFFVTVFKGVPLVLLGAPIEVFALVNVFSAIHGAYQHSNLPVRLGPLNWIFSLTELHRWHHSTRAAEANHNYGGNLIVWDIVFGTRWLPEDRDPPEVIGIEALPRFPMGYIANLAAPFRWKKLTREAGREGTLVTPLD